MKRLLNFSMNNYSVTLHKMVGNKYKGTNDKFVSFKKILNWLDLIETSNYKKIYKIEDF